VGGPAGREERRAPGAPGAVEVDLVDAHVHVFPPEIIRDRDGYRRRDGWFDRLYESPEARMATADDVVAQMEGAGVCFSLIFGFAFKDQGLCRMVNDYVLDSVKAHPGRLAGLACVSPEYPGAAAELERCLDAGLRGCGELGPDGQGFGEAWTGARGPVRDGISAIAGCLRERDLPLLVHSNEPVGHHYPGKGNFTPEACLALAQAHPGLKIVFAHLGGGLFLYELMPEVRRTLADVYYDTSAVPYLYGPQVYAAAVASAGYGKLIFGSDYPLLPPGRYLEGLESLPLPARAAVQAGNARKVFRI